MFLLVAMSKLVGSPFCLETMLRSGVPPHIGQSPVPGSPAANRAAKRSAPDTALNTFEDRIVKPLSSRSVPDSRSARMRTAAPPGASSVPGHLDVVEKHFKRRVCVNARTAFPIPNWIHFLDVPGRRLGFTCRPSLALRLDLALRQILDPQLQPVPGFRLPGEWHRGGSCGFRLPRLEFQPLVIAVERQLIALRHNSGIPHLPALIDRSDVGLDRVVVLVVVSNECASALSERVVGQLRQNRSLAIGANLILAGRIHPVIRRRTLRLAAVELLLDRNRGKRANPCRS